MFFSKMKKSLSLLVLFTMVQSMFLGGYQMTANAEGSSTGPTSVTVEPAENGKDGLNSAASESTSIIATCDSEYDGGFVWESSDSSVVELSLPESEATSSEVRATAVSPGTAEITATADNGVSGSCTIMVTDSIDNVSLGDHKTMYYCLIGETFQMPYSITPENTEMDKTLTWESSNPSVAEVDQNGVVTTKSVGEAVITATSVNGLAGEVHIRVNENLPTVQFDAPYYTTDTTELTVTGEYFDFLTDAIYHEMSGYYVMFTNNSEENSVGSARISAWYEDGELHVINELSCEIEKPLEPGYITASVYGDSLKGPGVEFYHPVTATVPVIDPDGDTDKDGVSDLDEVNQGTDHMNPDIDGDGIRDDVDTPPTDSSEGTTPKPLPPSIEADGDVEGIVVEGDGLPEGSTMVVEDTTEAEKANVQAQVDQSDLNYEVYSVLEFDLTDASGNAVHNLDGTVTVSIPVPAELVGKEDQIVILYISEDGTVTEVPTTVVDGMIQFTTDHFSTYAIALESDIIPVDPSGDSSTDSENPKTAGNGTMTYLVATAASLAGITTLRRKK